MANCCICGKTVKKNDFKVAFVISIVEEERKKAFKDALAGKYSPAHSLAHEDCAENLWEEASEY